MKPFQFNAKYQTLSVAPKLNLMYFLLGLNDEQIAKLALKLFPEQMFELLYLLSKNEIKLLFSNNQDKRQSQLFKKLAKDNLALAGFFQSLQDPIDNETIQKGKATGRKSLSLAGKHFGLEGNDFRAELIKLFWKHQQESVDFDALTNGRFDLRYLCQPMIRNWELEEKALKEIRKGGSILRIKSPYNMGKTSFTENLLDQLKRDKNYIILRYNFNECSQKLLLNYNQLMKNLCQDFSEQLNPNESLDQLDKWEHSGLTINKNVSRFFKKYFLSLPEQVILVLHNCDPIFETENHQDFCNLLRSWVQEANIEESWQKLNIIITHSTDIYAQMNINNSPLSNVGTSIELFPFTQRQIKDLSLRYLLELNEEDTESLSYWVGGHPYLVTLVFKKLANDRNQSLNDVLEEDVLITTCQEHLKRLLEILQSHPDLAKVYQKVITSSEPVKLETDMTFQLYGLGLTNIDSSNSPEPKSSCFCELYRLYFLTRL